MAIVGLIWASDTEDSWFSKYQGNQSAPAVEKSNDTIQYPDDLSYSEEEIFRVSMNHFERLPQTALRERLSILDRLFINTPKFRNRILPLKQEVEQDYQELRRVVDSVLTSTKDIERVCAILDPWSKYVCEEEDLLDSILQSSWMRTQKSHIAWKISNGHYEDVGRIEAARPSSRLSRLIYEQFREWIRECLVLKLDSILGTQQAKDSLEPFEAFLAGQLIGSYENKIEVQLNLPETWKAEEKALMRQEFQNAWGPVFEILEGGNSQSPDMILSLKSDPVKIECKESVETVESFVFGKITELPNPEFVELTAMYKKAAERYESDLQNYEAITGIVGEEAFDEDASDTDAFFGRDNTLFTDPGSSGGGTNSVTGFAQDASSAAFTNITTGGGNAMYVMANEQNQVRMDTHTIKREEPEPKHLEILDKLAEMESVIVESEPSTPYEYCSVTLNYVFENHGVMQLTSAGVGDVSVETPVELVHERSWTRNDGLQPGDPNARKGSYSEDAVDSAVKVFELQFADQCAASVADLLKEAKKKTTRADLLSERDDALWQMTLWLLNDKDGLKQLSNDQLLTMLRMSQNSSRFWIDLKDYLKRELRNQFQQKRTT